MNGWISYINGKRDCVSQQEDALCLYILLYWQQISGIDVWNGWINYINVKNDCFFLRENLCLNISPCNGDIFLEQIVYFC